TACATRPPLIFSKEELTCVAFRSCLVTLRSHRHSFIRTSLSNGLRRSMTEPTPVPDRAGGGADTVAARPTSTRGAGRAPNGSANGHRAGENGDQPGVPEEAGDGDFDVVPDPALQSDGQRSPEEVEAGIVALWKAFGERRDQELRDRLVLHYAPLVKYVAGRVGTGLPSHVEVSDLIQSGIFGLVDAIEKFEPERGLKFETYAMQRIRGAILDDLRAQDWVPRSVRS